MVTFANHPTHAPVVWLVNGDVTINGKSNPGLEKAEILTH